MWGARHVHLRKHVIGCTKKRVPRFLIFEALSAKSHEGSSSKKYQDHVPCSFAYKLVYVDDRFNKSVVLYRCKNTAYRFIEAILWRKYT